MANGKLIHEKCLRHPVIESDVHDVKTFLFDKGGLRDRMTSVEWQLRGILIMCIGIIGMLIRLIFKS